MTRLKKLIEKVEKEETPIEIGYRDIEKYLKYYSFALDRYCGSHHIFIDKNGNEITIPVHNNTVKYVYIKQIVKEVKKNG